MTELTSIDYAVILLYLTVILSIALWIGGYVRSGTDFFLAGRSLPWWAIGMSLIATDIGGVGLIGIGGDVYRYGIAMSNFEWIGCVPAMIVAAFVFVPHLWRCRVTSIPEYLELRFHGRLRTSVAACWLVFMVCNLGVMLLAAARFMNSLAGWDLSACILITALLVGVYTWLGGLGAVVYNDVLQGSVIIVGCLVLVLTGIYQLGGVTPLVDKVHAVARAREDDELRRREPLMTTSEIDAYTSRRRAVRPDDESAHMSLIQPVDSRSPAPWPAALFGICMVVGPGYWIGNQYVVQRALGAKSEYDAKASYIYAALLKNLVPFLVVIPGLIALVKFPEISHVRADAALGQLVGALLPIGFRGAFIAAILAALMSCVASYLYAATTLYVNDFYRRYYRANADEGQMLVVGRWTVVGFVGLGTYFAFQLLSFPDEGVYSIFQTLASFILGPTLAVLLSGICSRNASADGAFAGFHVGVLTSIGLFALNQPAVCRTLGLKPVFQIAQPYVYYSIWSFLVAMLFIVVFSYFLRSDPPERTRFALGGGGSEGGPT